MRLCIPAGDWLDPDCCLYPDACTGEIIDLLSADDQPYTCDSNCATVWNPVSQDEC